MKPIIIAIVGESGSGKTTLSRHLKEALNIPYVVSYTTRQMRENEVDGVDHWFANNMPVSPSQTLAYTLFSGNQYWTLPTQIDAYPIVSYVIDEKGLINLEERWGDAYQVVAVHVERPGNPTDAERVQRDKERVQYNNYACTITNLGTLPEFLETATETIETTITKIKS